MAAMARKAALAEPSVSQNWLTLGNLYWMSGRGDEAAEALSEGISRCRGDAALRVALARSLRGAGDYEAALEQCRAALEASPADAPARALAFMLLAKLGRWGEAAALLEDARAFDPCEPYIFTFLGRDLRTEEQVRRLLEACEAALSVNSACANAVYFKALGLAKLGLDAQAREVLSIERDVEIGTLDCPDPSLTETQFLERLADELRNHPGLMPDPRGKSTESGRQTPQLVAADGPAIAALLEALQENVDTYAAEVSASRRSTVPASASLVAWAVICGPAGRQRPHRHPDAWLSGVFYVQAPLAGGRYRGPLLLGTIDPALDVEPPWGVRALDPVPGRLVLFPSYMPHGTEASACPGDRICVAFDVVAAS